MTRRREEVTAGVRRAEIKLTSTPLSNLISVSGISQTRINRVWVKAGANEYDLYTHTTGKTTPKIPVGISWELHIEVQAYSDVGGWAQAVTIVSGGVAQVESDRKVTGGEWKKDFGFNMGAMPDAQVTITSIKHWVSNNYTITKPPQSEW